MKIDPAIKDRVLRNAIRTFGEMKQMDMMIEECSELIKALLKYRRIKEPNKTRDNIKNVREEMADVQIVLDQMKIIFGDTDNEEFEKIDYLSDLIYKQKQKEFEDQFSSAKAQK